MTPYSKKDCGANTIFFVVFKAESMQISSSVVDDITKTFRESRKHLYDICTAVIFIMSCSQNKMDSVEGGKNIEE